MTDTWAEQEARRLLGDCTCAEQYRRIRETVNPARRDPTCMWCNYGKDIATVLRRAEDRAYERAALCAEAVADYSPQEDDDPNVCAEMIVAERIRALKSSAE